MRDDYGYKKGIVLTGGGAYAAYEVGVMKALFAGDSPATDFVPFDPELFVGSSAGAMNLSVVLSREDVGLVAATKELERAWLEQIAEESGRCGNGVYRIRGAPFEMLDVDCLRAGPFKFLSAATEDAFHLARESAATAMRFATSREPVLARASRSLDLSSLVSPKPFEDTIHSLIPLDGLRASRRSIRIVAMNVSTGQLRLFTEQDIRADGYLPLLASTALPAFFKPTVVDGDYYIDGSTLAGTPLLPAIREADTLHVVYMDPDVSEISAQRLQNTVDVIDRTLVLKFAYAMNRDIRLAAAINRGLEMIQEGLLAEDLSDWDLHTFLRVGARIYRRMTEGRPYRPLTIHRYHPRQDLGESLGLMNLGRERIRVLIERGYKDAVNHDCESSGCVIPGRPIAEYETGTANRDNEKELV